MDIFIDDNKYKKDVSLPFDTKKILDSENIDTDQELGIILFVSPIHLRKVIARTKDWKETTLYMYDGTGTPRSL